MEPNFPDLMEKSLNSRDESTSPAAGAPGEDHGCAQAGTEIPVGEVLAIGSDHAAWPLKETVRKHLESKGLAVRDFSLADESPADYTEIGLAVAESIVRGDFRGGILLCGTGLGMSILANKLPGIRACLCHDTYSARMSRAHNNCNILVMGGRIIGSELAKEIVSAWLETAFEGGRHQRRLDRIGDVERSLRGKPA